MKNHKKVLLSSLLLFAFNGCGEVENSISSIAKDNSTTTNESNSSIAKDNSTTTNESKLFDLDSEIKQARSNGWEVGNFWSDADYPILEFKDKKPIIVLTLNQPYTDSGVEIIDSKGNDLSDKVKVSGHVDTTTVGKYICEYMLQDKNGYKFGLRRHVFVVKNTAPTIKLKGPASLTTQLGATYVDSGYTVFDREDMDEISSKVKITGNLNLTKEGEYQITYSVTDSANQTATITRDIRVEKAEDIKAEVLKTSTKPNNFQYKLWDYMVDTENTKKHVSKYDDQRHLYTYTRIFSNNESKKTINLSYTNRQFSYERLTDVIKVDIENDSLLLKQHAKLHDSITQTTTGCTITEHYDTIRLANTLYKDVIKISCDKLSEAYFQKDRGIILENLLHKEEKLDTLGLKEFAYTLPKLKIIDFKPETIDSSYYLGEYNLKGEKLTNTDKVQAAPYNLSGEGITIGVVDSGNILNTHVEFTTNRAKNLSDTDISSHSTHVAGTIGARGINPLAKGYANQVNIESVSFEEHSEADSLTYFAKKDILITNHSYGHLYGDGEYTYSSHKIDQVITNNNYIIAIVAAGNERDTNEKQYSIIKDGANAKNIITVGALGTKKELSYFSCTGPTTHGRIKPDVVARGEKVYSLAPNSNNKSYQKLQGTSMATPAVTGMLTLLQERYIKINSEKMREDIAKGLLVQSATDLGRSGPDYEYGFGLPDTLKAVKLIDSMKTKDTLVQDKEIKKGDYNRYKFTIDTFSKKVRFTLSWIDPTSSIKYGQEHLYTSELNTDLDMTIIDNFGNIVYAYTLDSQNPEKSAKKNIENRVDNIEQIEATLNPGAYRLYIKVHKMKNSNSQKYALFSNIALKEYTAQKGVHENIDEFETKILNISKD